MENTLMEMSGWIGRSYLNRYVSTMNSLVDVKIVKYA